MMKQNQVKISLSARNMLLIDLMRELSRKTGFTIVCAASIDSQKINIDVRNQSALSVINVVSKKIGADVIRVGDIFYIGSIKPEDRVLLVRQVKTPALDSGQLKTALSILLSKDGKVEAYPGGLVVVSDKMAVIERAAELLEHVETAKAPTWVIQLYIVSVEHSQKESIGVDSDLNMSAYFAAQSNTYQAGLDGELLAVFEAQQAIRNGRIVSQPLVIVNDGESVSLASGVTTPIPQKTVSQYGVVETKDYEYVQSGFDLTVSLAEVSPEQSKIKLRLSVSDITGYVEDAPVLKNDKLNISATMTNGGIKLLASLNQYQDIKGTDGFLQALRVVDKGNKQLQVWAKAARVGQLVVEKPNRVIVPEK